MNKSKKVLITGIAGFIGFHVAQDELKKGNIIIGVDNLNNYYDKKIKISRLKILKKYKNFIFFKMSLLDDNFYKSLKKYYNNIEYIIHLAGQAGVRHSIKYPEEFWSQVADDVFWYKKPTKILNSKNPPFYKWYEDGITNTCFNAVDLHVKNGNGQKLAIIYDSPITNSKKK